MDHSILTKSVIDYDKFCYNILGTKSPIKGGLPRPKDFSKALYIIDIGQNDLSHHLKNDSKEQFKSSIPTILKIFNNATQVIFINNHEVNY